MYLLLMTTGWTVRRFWCIWRKWYVIFTCIQKKKKSLKFMKLLENSVLWGRRWKTRSGSVSERKNWLHCDGYQDACYGRYPSHQGMTLLLPNARSRIRLYLHISFTLSLVSFAFTLVTFTFIPVTFPFVLVPSSRCTIQQHPITSLHFAVNHQCWVLTTSPTYVTTLYNSHNRSFAIGKPPITCLLRLSLAFPEIIPLMNTPWLPKWTNSSSSQHLHTSL